MHRLLAVTAAIALSMPAAAPALTRARGSGQPDTTPACKHFTTQPQFRHYTRRVYKRPTVSRDARQRMVRLIECHASRDAQRNSRIFRRHHKKHRAVRLAYVPVSAALERIAACESGGNPRAIGGGGAFRGKYQFLVSTWESVGGRGDPAAAPEAEQDMRAAMLLERSGSAPWPVCG